MGSGNHRWLHIVLGYFSLASSCNLLGVVATSLRLSATNINTHVLHQSLLLFTQEFVVGSKIRTFLVQSCKKVNL